MWTGTARMQHVRVGIGLPSYLTDEEWAVIEPLLPARSGLGRSAKWTYLQIMNGLFYVLRAGLPWQVLPRGEFAPIASSILSPISSMHVAARGVHS